MNCMLFIEKTGFLFIINTGELDEYAGNKSADHIHLIILESKML